MRKRKYRSKKNGFSRASIALFSLVVLAVTTLVSGFLITVNPNSSSLFASAARQFKGKVKPTPTPTPILTSGPCAGSTGNVQVKYPNGGETFTVGDKVDIQWCLNNYSAYSQAYSSIWLTSRQTQVDGTFVYQNQVPIFAYDNKVPATGQLLMQTGLNTYSWTIPDSYTFVDPVTNTTTTVKVGGGSYVIMVAINGSGTGSYDYSDNTFTINNTSITPAPTTTACANSAGTVAVLVPNGGEAYALGNTMTIKWCVNDYSQYNQNYASIWLSTRTDQLNGSPIYRNQVQISNNTAMNAGENSLSWTIPSTLSAGGNYVILVNINSFLPNYDYSDGVFSITP